MYPLAPVTKTRTFPPCPDHHLWPRDYSVQSPRASAFPQHAHGTDTRIDDVGAELS
jgi:hypothetical protein